MNNQVVIGLLVIIVIQAEHCSKDKNQGPFTLLKSSRMLPSRRQVEIKFIKAVISGSASFHIGYRERWTSYCYNGGALDPNTGCINNLKSYPPTDGEIVDWVSTKKCKVGNLCKGVWGSDANFCCLNEDIREEVPLGTEIEKASSNNNFAYHTCTSSWRCGAIEVASPLILTRTPECKGLTGTPNPKCYVISYPSESGVLTPLPPSGTLIPSKGSEKIYMKHDAAVKFYEITANCTVIGRDLKPAPPKRKRKKKQDNDLKNPPDPGFFVTLCRHGEELFEPGDCLGDVCFSDGGEPTNASHLPFDWKPASEDDLHNMIRQLDYNNVELMGDIIGLAKKVQDLEDMVRILIFSVAKIDERLIGNIFGSGFQTSFLNNETFFVQPCAAPISLNSNCANGKIFKGGRWVEIEDQTDCINFDKVKGLNLFEDTQLFFPTILNQTFHGTAKDLPSWAFIVSQQSNLANTMEYTHYGGPGSALEDVVTKPKGYFESLTHINLALPFLTLLLGLIFSCCTYYFSRRRNI